MKTLKIGTRGSRLAIAQAEEVEKALRKAHPHLQVEIVRYKTTGDIIQNHPLGTLKGKSFFTKEIEEGLLKKEIDLAVHSAKDLSALLPQGLKLAVTPEREPGSDIFLAHSPTSLKALPPGSRLGTSSVRRRAQLSILNSEWDLVELRGNVDSRLRKLEEGFFEGIVIALAGLKRLGLLKEWPHTEILEEKEFLPSPCQGALGLQVREEDKETEELLAPLNHEPSHLRLRAERAFLAKLQASCKVPIGLSSEIQGDNIVLNGAIFSLNGKESVRWNTHGEFKNPEEVGTHLAEWLLNAGGDKLLKELEEKE